MFPHSTTLPAVAAPPTAGQEDTPCGDERAAGTLLRQWERINSVRSQMVKAGLIDGDATPAQVLARLREILPIDVMS